MPKPISCERESNVSMNPPALYYTNKLGKGVLTRSPQSRRRALEIKLANAQSDAERQTILHMMQKIPKEIL